MDKLERKGLHDQITKKLGVAVLRGELHEGEVSSELALCKSLGVSRTVLRESIKVLVSKGLVEVRPKVGLRILPKHNWNLFDPDVLAWQSEAVLAVDESFVRTLCEVRLIVETAAAGLAASRATAEEKAVVAECFRAMERLVDDKPAHDEADIAFHGAIFDASHNELLQQIGKTIRAALRRQDRSGSESGVAQMMEKHAKVCEAICNGDAKMAASAMEAVIFDGAQSFFRSSEFEISTGRDWYKGPEQSTSTASELTSARNLLRDLQETLRQYAGRIDTPGDHGAPTGDSSPLPQPSDVLLKPSQE